ncbi:hypothetical protein [Paraburkholderia mimosarum]|uniref:hypothetical protein n=1 Tax=Paraburkholderia mimosarum TaxID=312026 RepID=UPI0012B61114|nr:hypothetical protein [Paraburkholderia mimosarum]
MLKLFATSVHVALWLACLNAFFIGFFIGYICTPDHDHRWSHRFLASVARTLSSKTSRAHESVRFIENLEKIIPVSLIIKNSLVNPWLERHSAEIAAWQTSNNVEQALCVKIAAAYYPADGFIALLEQN